MDREKIIDLLRSEGVEQRELLGRAEKIRNDTLGNDLYFRGLLEFSNVCENDCLYCGIRRSNREIGRFSMTTDEILDATRIIYERGFRSMVLQSGERTDSEFVSLLERTLIDIKREYPDMGITLSVGEQEPDVYRRFFEAGAHRYLLRIETSSPEHYGRLHPEEMSWEKRVGCLDNLKDIGYQVGTGVMIGSTFQTIRNLADDILFFRDRVDVDMVGMGPYIEHPNTPLGGRTIEYPDRKKRMSLALNMIALLRLNMPDINIASTTALQALVEGGRTMGLKAGANVVMPLFTPEKYRTHYSLYNGKPYLDETREGVICGIMEDARSAGMVPRLNEWGDSLHFFRRNRIEH